MNSVMGEAQNQMRRVPWHFSSNAPQTSLILQAIVLTFFACVCMCVMCDVCIYLGRYVHSVDTCAETRGESWVFFISHLCVSLKQDISLNLKLLFSVRPSRKISHSDFLVSALLLLSQDWGDRCTWPQLAFYMGVGD